MAPLSGRTRERLSARHARAAPATPVAELGVVRRLSTFHQMKTPFLRLAFAALLLVASTRAAEPLPPVLGTDSLGLPYRVLFQTDTNTVTAVQITGDVLNVKFTGRWLSSSKTKFPDTDKSGFTVNRNKGVSQADWEALGRRFSECLGKSITLLVFVDSGYLIRDGNPVFSFPQDRFQIPRPGERFNFPIGYQF